MVIPYALAQVLLVPLVFTPIAYCVGKRVGKGTGWLTAVPLAYTLLLLVGVAAEIQGGGAYAESYKWAPDAGLTFGLKADGLRIWVLLTVNVLCPFIRCS